MLPRFCSTTDGAGHRHLTKVVVRIRIHRAGWLAVLEGMPCGVAFPAEYLAFQVGISFNWTITRTKNNKPEGQLKIQTNNESALCPIHPTSGQQPQSLSSTTPSSSPRLVLVSKDTTKSQQHQTGDKGGTHQTERLDQRPRCEFANSSSSSSMSKTTASAAWLTQFGLLMWKNWTLSVLLGLLAITALIFHFCIYLSKFGQTSL